jgi:hypothetical protein
MGHLNQLPEQTFVTIDIEDDVQKHKCNNDPWLNGFQEPRCLTQQFLS